MKKITLLVAALVCACLLTAGTASAKKRTPVAGFSPSFAKPQPATPATLYENANRLIRWQGWLSVDAFAMSILEQMQKRLENGLDNSIELGTFTIAEPSINTAILAAKAKDPSFEMNSNLGFDAAGESFDGNVTLYVWTYRHNYTDTGLYQLYVSVQGKMLIGKGIKTECGGDPILHNDIQALGYEFGRDGYEGWENPYPVDVYANVEIWRGAVVDVNARGILEVVGNEAGVIPYKGSEEDVQAAPVSAWERAPSLICNENFNPQSALGIPYVTPLERNIRIWENKMQKETGDVRTRVKVTSPVRRAACL
jgi:hypothetical protein